MTQAQYDTGLAEGLSPSDNPICFGPYTQLDAPWRATSNVVQGLRGDQPSDYPSCDSPRDSNAMDGIVLLA